jgi:hypothetical protein
MPVFRVLAANRAVDGAPTGCVKTSPAVNSRINSKYSFLPVKQAAKPGFRPGFMQLPGLVTEGHAAAPHIHPGALVYNDYPDSDTGQLDQRDFPGTVSAIIQPVQINSLDT